MKKSFLAFCLISLVMIGCAVKTVNPIKDSLKNEVLRRNPLNKNLKDPLPEPREDLGSGSKNRRSRIFQRILKSDYSNAELVDGTLSYTVNPGWQRVPVSSPLRVDQIIIDPVSQTELNVFFFEGMTNAVEANLSRWKAQFKPDTRKLVDNKQFNLGKIPITIFSMTGTYLRPLEQLNPDSPKEELNDYAMYAIIAELKSGTWFFKAYGPEPVIMSQVSNFERFVAGFKVAP